jgi:RND family efflux transporter MFP subunit
MTSGLRSITAVAALSLAFAGCSEEVPPPVEGPRPVKLLEIGGGGGTETREYPGRIKAGQYSEMSFEVAGRVTEFVYTEGAAVKSGSVLARLDPRDYQSRYDSSSAKASHARSERDRYKEMYEKEVKPYSEYELRMRAYEVAQADLQEAKKALDDTLLRAPFDGVMARKLVEQFENVQAKQPVLVMQNDDLLEIKVNVPERDLAQGSGRRLDVERLTRQISPRVVISSLPDRQFEASLTEVASVADPTTRTFEATFRFAKPQGANVLGGMTAKVIVSIAASNGRKGVWIPASAVISSAGEGATVWVVDPSTLTVSARRVELGDLEEDRVAIAQGLEAGETIAISGVHQLRDGMTVRRYQP